MPGKTPVSRPKRRGIDDDRPDGDFWKLLVVGRTDQRQFGASTALVPRLSFDRLPERAGEGISGRLTAWLG